MDPMERLVSAVETPRPRTRRRLATFTGHGYTKGAGSAKCALWVALGQPLQSLALCPPSLRVRLLRAFGAEIGPGVLIRHDVRIHWPWKLSVGSNSWIGVGAHLLNLEPIRIGDDVCISQEALLCTGSHRADDPAFEFDNAPITVRDGAWVATRATVLRGVTIGTDCVVGSTALVTEDVADGTTVLAPRAEQR